MSLKLFQTAHAKVERFRSNRTRQVDEDFLAECEIIPGSDRARIALGVRRCVADAGLIDSAFIRPTDRFPDDLGVLPLWDSMDFLDLVIRLERELNISFESHEGGKVFKVPFNVRELINRVASVAVPVGSLKAVESAAGWEQTAVKNEH
jgi:acyl carrier protein